MPVKAYKASARLPRHNVRICDGCSRLDHITPSGVCAECVAAAKRKRQAECKAKETHGSL